jgi:hypothetical protein
MGIIKYYNTIINAKIDLNKFQQNFKEFFLLLNIDNNYNYLAQYLWNNKFDELNTYIQNNNFLDKIEDIIVV